MHFSKARVHRILCLVKIQYVYLEQLRPKIIDRQITEAYYSYVLGNLLIYA